MVAGIVGKVRWSAWATTNLNCLGELHLPMKQIRGEVLETPKQILYSRLYTALCSLLSGKDDRTSWASFSEQDWGAFLVLAQAQGVAPLVYATFQASNRFQLMPQKVLASLRDMYYQSLAQNSLLLRDLEGILGVLAAAHIPAIVLKGAHLAVDLYPDCALRPMHDLDVLVREDDFEGARQALESIGYTQPFPVLSQRVTRQVGFELYLSKPGGRTPGIELHWGLVGGREDRRSPPVSWFWENTQPFSMFNHPYDPQYIRALNPTANLLYLCAHLFLEHGGASERLLWLYDIYLLLCRWGAEINWDILLNKAGELDWTQPLFSGLWAAQQDLVAPLPGGLLDELQSSNPGLIVPLRGVYQPQPPHAQATWEALSRLRWRARLRLALALLFPSPAHLRWRYQPNPPWLLPLYYPLKWAEMLWDGLNLLRGLMWR